MTFYITLTPVSLRQRAEPASKQVFQLFSNTNMFPNMPVPTLNRHEKKESKRNSFQGVPISMEETSNQWGDRHSPLINNQLGKNIINNRRKHK